MSSAKKPAPPPISPKEAIAAERRARAALDAATRTGDDTAIAEATELLAVVVAEKAKVLAGWERHHAAAGPDGGGA